MLEWVIGAAVVLAALLTACLWAFKAGKEKAKKTKAEQINDAAEKAAGIRDRLKSDPSFAKRVRERFTR